MYGIETINSLNTKAAESAYLMKKHSYLDSLTPDQRFAFSQLSPDMQRVIVNDLINN